MNGYRNLASSPPAPSGGEPEPEPAPPPAAAKEGKWEGATVGAAAMVRNLSSASQRFAAVERSKSTGGHRGGGGFQAAVRRAFSMRRQPASGLSEGYWRIHDGLDDAEDEAEAPEEVDAQKKTQVAEAAVPGDAAASNDEIGQEETKKKKKKRGHIFKACKKLLGFKHV
ncbi:uncharacterized protein LOC119269793 [Triticum dicoccoides]|uniref:uncharacterized protein LOC119269793 n=1 Tax=Triticum dicoccoides TaxID=85692 RepID=UPI00188DE05C|nr:uncharacterized protein LOC119269793 [Triticum dicoccoides]